MRTHIVISDLKDTTRKPEAIITTVYQTFSWKVNRVGPYELETSSRVTAELIYPAPGATA
jgi:hypothetical protein